MSTNENYLKPVHLEFISPTPVLAATHIMEVAQVKLLNRFHQAITASWRAISAPAHLKIIKNLPVEQKKYTLPIVPNTDFIPAIQGDGPAPCHSYEQPISDLKFVASISPTPWALITCNPEITTPDQLIGKKIGLEAEGGSPRVLADAVLKDAWAIKDKVELKDYHPSQVMQGLQSGDIDATFWMQVWDTLGGIECSFRDLLVEKDIYWINLSFEDIERINEKNNWQLGRVLIPKGSIRVSGSKLDPPTDVGLPLFTGAICAWDETEDEVAFELVRFLSKKSELWPDVSGGCPLSLARMSRYPGLQEEMVHPGALEYYRKKKIQPGSLVQLPDFDG